MMAAARRPALVTVLVVLIVIGGALDLLAGILMIVFQKDAEVQQAAQASGTTPMLFGIGAIVIGVVYLAIGRALGNGSGFARGLVAVVSLINFGLGIWAAFAYTGQIRIAGIVNAAIGLLILIILYTPRANAFFREN